MKWTPRFARRRLVTALFLGAAVLAAGAAFAAAKPPQPAPAKKAAGKPAPAAPAQPAAEDEVPL